MQKLSLVDETFDTNLTFEYNISIQLSLDGFSFSILDTLQNKVVYLYYQELFENTPDITVKHLAQIYDENDLLKLPYKNTQFYHILTEDVQLIPTDAIQPEDIATVQDIVFDRKANSSSITFNKPFFNYSICANIPSPIQQFIEQQHPSTQMQTVLNNWEKALEREQHVAHIYINRRFVSVLVKDDNNLACYNSFVWISEMDLIYFILGAIKNSGAQVDKLILNGIVNKFSHIYHQLKLYFKSVELVEKPKELQYSYLIEKLPDARFVDLFNTFYL